MISELHSMHRWCMQDTFSLLSLLRHLGAGIQWDVSSLVSRGVRGMSIPLRQWESMACVVRRFHFNTRTAWCRPMVCKSTISNALAEQWISGDTGRSSSVRISDVSHHVNSAFGRFLGSIASKTSMCKSAVCSTVRRSLDFIICSRVRYMRDLPASVSLFAGMCGISQCSPSIGAHTLQALLRVNRLQNNQRGWSVFDRLALQLLSWRRAALYFLSTNERT